MKCSYCGHVKEVHNDADAWYSEGAEEETWTNDACSTCGRDKYNWPNCMHFKVEEEKE